MWRQIKIKVCICKICFKKNFTFPRKEFLKKLLFWVSDRKHA